ncbi:arylsulfatase A [Streptomyces sp. CBMAI 2042]|nr:arylsulfatase A [Streptomyces sp. CBMAI 2042]
MIPGPIAKALGWSPRVRGCSAHGAHLFTPGPVVPARAGVFPASAPTRASWQVDPRACGSAALWVGLAQRPLRPPETGRQAGVPGAWGLGLELRATSFGAVGSLFRGYVGGVRPEARVPGFGRRDARFGVRAPSLTGARNWGVRGNLPYLPAP